MKNESAISSFDLFPRLIQNVDLESCSTLSMTPRAILSKYFRATDTKLMRAKTDIERAN
jgi:hypothetical protein